MRVSDRHVQILLSEYEEKCVYIYTDISKYVR